MLPLQETVKEHWTLWGEYYNGGHHAEDNLSGAVQAMSLPHHSGDGRPLATEQGVRLLTGPLRSRMTSWREDEQRNE